MYVNTKEIPVLDKGFIRVVDWMGDDKAVVQAARVSYGEGTKTVQEDEGLIRYLMRHYHTTPMEMCEIKLHVKLPLFVARQWIRHRTANVNEMSGRYSVLPNEFYIPEAESIRAQSLTNMQGRDDEEFAAGNYTRMVINEQSDDSYRTYERLLENKVARELARMVLPTNIYTEWYWKIDLHNLLHFLYLRDDPHAQWEIQQYAKVLSGIVAEWVPMVHQAFLDYKVNAITFSAQEVQVLQSLFDLYRPALGKPLGQAPQGMSKREWNEFEMKWFKLTS